MSGETNAFETEVPPPEWGKPIKVKLQKRGFFDADYNVLLGERGNEEEWMLIDAVGGMFDSGFNYFLKHRSPGQVDADKKPCSTVLGAVDIKGEWDAFSFKVSGRDRHTDLRPFIDLWDGDIDFGVSSSSTLWAVWTYSKRAVLWADHEMKKQVGWLDVTGSGTWYEHEYHETVWDTDRDGRRVARRVSRRKTDCRVHGFRYKLNVFNCPMVVTYKNMTPNGLFSAAKLHFTAANAWSPSVPLFTVVSDGENNAEVQTFENSDPVSTLLAAYAISCKLEPADFREGARSMCERHMSLGMPPGHSNFIGMHEQTFERTFSYPAAPPPVFADAVAAFKPPPAVLIPFATAAPPMGTPGQPPMAMAQPVVQPGVPVGVPVAQPVGQQPAMAQQTGGYVANYQ